MRDSIESRSQLENPQTRINEESLVSLVDAETGTQLLYEDCRLVYSHEWLPTDEEIKWGSLHIWYWENSQPCHMELQVQYASGRIRYEYASFDEEGRQTKGKSANLLLKCRRTRKGMACSLKCDRITEYLPPKESNESPSYIVDNLTAVIEQPGWNIDGTPSPERIPKEGRASFTQPETRTVSVFVDGELRFKQIPVFSRLKLGNEVREARPSEISIWHQEGCPTRRVEIHEYAENGYTRIGWLYALLDEDNNIYSFGKMQIKPRHRTIKGRKKTLSSVHKTLPFQPADERRVKAALELGVSSNEPMTNKSLRECFDINEKNYP